MHLIGSKIPIFFIIFISYIKYYGILQINNLKLNDYYFNIQKNLNLTFDKKINNKIKIGIYSFCLKNGGRARITSLFLKYLENIKIFKLYLFTKKSIEDNEYFNPKSNKRIVIKNYNIKKLIKEILKNNIDIFVYQVSNDTEIHTLNNFKKIKILFYQHQSFFYWIYKNYLIFKSLYKEYQNCKYIISLVPFENDYLFYEWGIKSILMNNFITYRYNYVISSDLSSKIILMIGRGSDKLKRFDLGIHSMKYIKEDIYDCKMRIISDLKNIYDLINLVNNLDLEKDIIFIGYTLTPEIYFKNASLHIFPTISESFGLVLGETKIYGIPNILVGLNYVSIAKGGTIIIYDDSPESIAKISINILKNENYRKNLGKRAKISMKLFKNDILLKNWIKILLSIYNGEIYYNKLRNKKEKKISKKDFLKIIKKQVFLLKMRKSCFQNMTKNKIMNFSFLENNNF